MSDDRLSEEQVARLLRSSGGDEPLPPAVAARLDDVLADLVAERAGTGPGPDRDTDSGTDSGTVTPLRPRRRLGTAARGLLVAAAVLGVVGVGAGVVSELRDASGEAESASAGSTADESAAGESGSGAGGGRASGGGDAAEESAGEALSAPRTAREQADALRADVYVITDRADLRATVRALGARDGAATSDARDQQDLRAGLTAASCAVPAGPDGQRFLVRYRGEPATLVVRRTADGTEGRVHSCSLGLLRDGVTVANGPGTE